MEGNQIALLGEELAKLIIKVLELFQKKNQLCFDRCGHVKRTILTAFVPK